MKSNPKKTFYVTTPIYYPSGDLHIGHLYTTNIAWILRNYKRLVGYDAIMLTGSDEHGLKIQRKANEERIEPQAYVDKQNEKFIALWKKYHIDFDLYSRTSSTIHKNAVQKQFSELTKKHDIVLGKYTGLYSVSDEEFLAPSQANQRNGKYYHPVSGHELMVVSEESYMFLISKYQSWLTNYFASHHDFIIPNKIEKELVNNFLSKGLEDLSVSRSTFDWGIKIIENEKHVVYVWLDALNNYITALGYKSPNDAMFKKYWENGDEIIHVVGKEIARFHGIYWPIILHASNIKIPTHILAHGWIITPEGKMSKSKGNVVNPIDLADRYDYEAIKYFFGSQIDIANDGIFSEEMLKNVYNSDLVNNYSNLVSRTLGLYQKNLSKLPKIKIEKGSEKEKVLDQIITSINEYQKFFTQFEIHHGLKEAMRLSASLNKFIDETAPWKMGDNKQELGQIIACLVNGIYAVTTMLSVALPVHTKKVQDILKMTSLSIDLSKDHTKFDEKDLGVFSPIFERI